MTAMTTGYTGKNGQPTEQLVRYCEERAKGGVGLIVTEIFRVNEEHGVAIGNQLSALDVNNLPSLAMGQKPDSAAVAAFDAAFDRVVVLGENRRVPGRIATSLSDAYIAAFAFDPEA